SPYEYLPNMPDPWKYNHMNIIIGTGEWDNTRHESMRLSGILNSKGIRNWLDDRKWCGHEWKYWRDMLPYYLSTFWRSLYEKNRQIIWQHVAPVLPLVPAPFPVIQPIA